MSPGAKLTVFMVLAVAAFVVLRWLLARVLGPAPGPTQDAPPVRCPLRSEGLDAAEHHGSPD